MKYQCAKCETIFEHEKYLTECEGEKVCPICETVEPVYKLRNPHERVVNATLAERDRILLDLKTKRSTFLDKGKFGRAETIGEIIKGIETGEITDYKYLDSVGIEVECERPKYIIREIH